MAENNEAKRITPSRRAILKSIGLVGLGSVTLFRPDALDRIIAVKAEELAGSKPYDQQFRMPSRWQGEPIGRITGEYMNARVEPSVDADVATQLYQDDLVRVRRVVEGQTVYLHNDLWLETSVGYFYSSFVQPIWYQLPNTPVSREEIGLGRWVELTVPYSDAYWATEETGKASDNFVGRMYYGTTHRVIGVEEDGRDGKTWYRVKELYGEYWMRATHLRMIPDYELTPISADVDPRDKLMVVDRGAQTLTAYEGENVVFEHFVSTGRPGKATPDGTFHVVDKRISERMVGGTAANEEDSELYNLAGVAFVCYFTWDWVATHGCYWHNDYGQVRSSGCVNLPADAARWIWRWTTPHPPLDEFYYRPENATEGTKVVVY